MTQEGKRRLILASSSPRRRQLIRSLRLPFSVITADVDESVPPGLAPSEIVEQLALRKASAAYNGMKADRNGQAGIIVGADTVVVWRGNVLGKPRDRAHARDMLAQLRGNRHEVYSGLTLIDAETGRGRAGLRKPAGDTTMRLGDIGQYRVLSESPEGKPEVMVGHTVSRVAFGPMSDEEIRAYVETGEPLDKAGAYGVQGLGAVFIEKIEGDFYSVMGLPLNLLYRMLIPFGTVPQLFFHPSIQ